MASPTKARQIQQAIADDIVHGRLAPGTALDETSIAAAFGVSRTPIREAIRQLEAIGLIEARARRGAVVADLSDRQLDEMFAVMAELEALCARWSAIVMTAAERRHLLACRRKARGWSRPATARPMSISTTASTKRSIAGPITTSWPTLALNVRTRCAPFRRAQFETLGRLAKSHAEHEAVVTAIQRGDADAAATEMRAHIIVVRTAVDAVAGEAARRRGEPAAQGRKCRRESRGVGRAALAAKWGSCRASPNF